MPLAFIIIGFLVIVTAYRGTYKQMATQLASDFSGSGNFIYWVAAVGILGMIGYAKPARPFSRALIALIVVAFVLANKGLFAKFQSALGAPTNIPAVPEPTAPGPLPIKLEGLPGGGGGGGIFGDIFGAVTKGVIGSLTGGGSVAADLAGSAVGTGIGPGTGGLY